MSESICWSQNLVFLEALALVFGVGAMRFLSLLFTSGPREGDVSSGGAFKARFLMHFFLLGPRVSIMLVDGEQKKLEPLQQRWVEEVLQQ